MRIENHRLVEAADGIRVEYREDPDAHKGGVLVPEIAVVHYSVTTSAQATARVLDDRSFVSCHVTIDRTGLVIQQVPFNRVAWHAGDSLYQGRPKVSRFSLGIEISNPGPLRKQGAGEFFTTYGRRWTGEVVEAWHQNDTRRIGWQYWAGYSATEIDLVVHLCELFRREYGIKDIVGHDQIAPGRKSDPGPAFPLEFVREAVLGSALLDPADEPTRPEGEPVA